jgi:predicted ATPase with chaperone activity
MKPANERSKWPWAAWASPRAPTTAVLKVARTLLELARFETVAAKHFAEAVQHGSLDRNYWN